MISSVMSDHTLFCVCKALDQITSEIGSQPGDYIYRWLLYSSLGVCVSIYRLTYSLSLSPMLMTQTASIHVALYYLIIRRQDSCLCDQYVPNIVHVSCLKYCAICIVMFE